MLNVGLHFRGSVRPSRASNAIGHFALTVLLKQLSYHIQIKKVKCVMHATFHYVIRFLQIGELRKHLGQRESANLSLLNGETIFKTC